MSKTYIREWSENELKIIEAVKQYPAIYKRKFGKKPARMDSWTAVTKKTGLPGMYLDS